MDKETLEGSWKKLKGDIQARWGKLTDDQLDQIDGNREKFLGALQENYGVVRDDAERQLIEFEKSLAS